MIQSDEGKSSAAAGGANDFEAMFEESLRSVKPGGIVKGMVVGNHSDARANRRRLQIRRANSDP